jgi:hypothetical protein
MSELSAPSSEAVQSETNRIYPGDLATPQQIRQLAEEPICYSSSSVGVITYRWHPYRSAAVLAIELYQNALLLQQGHDSSYVRSIRHNLTARMEAAIASRLRLRKRTAAHLQEKVEQREYLVSRYGPELTGTISKTNRLMATLEEGAQGGCNFLSVSAARPPRCWLSLQLQERVSACCHCCG